MNAETWQEVERHLASMLELSPVEREGYLDRACGENTALRGLVESMLAHDSEMGSFLETEDVPGFAETWTEDLRRTLASPGLMSRPRRAGAGPRDTDPDLAELLPGSRLGPYRVEGEIGRGGMSVVYLATHLDLQRRVALKVIKRGMDSAEIQRRFLDERKILANLNHPSICQFYEGGTTEDGLPYFVMEHIEGEPIDRFCDRRRLPIPERLELFRRVCAAVHYAHQNLVVHRDLKPSNILVTGEGVPKLLDFGIAKLLNPGIRPARPEPTATCLRLLTPSYASPEQIAGQMITTSSDIYSLGVLLYELLTGRLPHRGGSPAEAVEAVEPRQVKPSVAVLGAGGSGADDAEATRLAGLRATTPEKLARRLRGDLETIVLKALRVEPRRRYGSAVHFSEDVRRIRLGLPITARQDTFGYRCMTFLRRHRSAAVLVATAVALVMGFAVVAALQAARAEQERLQTAQVAEFLIDLFDGSASGAARRDVVTARELLDRGAERVDRELRGQPKVQATLMDTIGRAYSNLRFYELAIPHFEKALDLRRRTLGPQSPEVAASLRHLAIAQWGTGDYDASEGSFLRALDIHRGLDGPRSPEIAEILYGYARLWVSWGDQRRAKELARQSAQMRRDLLGEDHPLTARSQTLLAECLTSLGEYRQAEEHLQRAIESLRRAPDEAKELARALNSLGFLRVDEGRLAAAEAPIHESLEIRRHWFGEDHPAYAESLSITSFLLVEKAEYEAAIPMIRQALEVNRRRHGPTHPEVARDMFNLGEALAASGAYGEAEETFREALELARRLVAEEHPRLANLRVSLAATLHAQERFEEAEALYVRGLSTLLGSVGDDHLFVALARAGLGGLRADQGRWLAARTLLESSLPVLEKVLGADHWRAAHARSELAGCLMEERDYGGAETLLQSSYPILLERRGMEARETQRAQAQIRYLEELSEGSARSKSLLDLEED